MKNDKHVLVIDAGNTSIKVGWFKNDNLILVKRFSLKNLREIDIWLKSVPNYEAIMSSVLSDHDTFQVKEIFNNCEIVTSETDFPIQLDYETKNTLGIDRICNAVYAFVHSNTDHAVTIDIGTCVKFDLTGIDGHYLGGSISPGIHLRYKALNDYTGKLPLISNKTATKLVGTTTDSCIHSGVINGLRGELSTMMKEYSEQFLSLTFFMTGGDASSFELVSKNDIFADENLTLRGLYEIYKHNA